MMFNLTKSEPQQTQNLDFGAKTAPFPVRVKWDVLRGARLVIKLATSSLLIIHSATLNNHEDQHLRRFLYRVSENVKTCVQYRQDDRFQGREAQHPLTRQTRTSSCKSYLPKIRSRCRHHTCWRQRFPDQAWCDAVKHSIASHQQTYHTS